ncbi:MAG TPA: RNA methyltransferase [Nitrospiraceae bacterium]|nr:RNA methyltransferase [Nitrospiraceae bacterium]
MAAAVPLLTRSQGSHIRGLLREKSVRAQSGSFVVEGSHAVKDLLTRYPDQILAIVSAQSYLRGAGKGSRVIRVASSTKQYSCSDLQFSKLSDLDAPQGILAVVRQPAWDEGNVLRQPTVLGIFGEELQDPTNVGAIIRTAAALNLSALWLTPGSADVYHPKVVRATSGSLLNLPVFIAKDVSGLIREDCGVFAAEATGNGTVPIDEIRQVPRRLILAVGNEGRGLSAQLGSQATIRFTIPLSRDIESLNVAATVAIAAFHFSRLPKRE